jgi:F0F1-type ATP synthase delta subunit
MESLCSGAIMLGRFLPERVQRISRIIPTSGKDLTPAQEEAVKINLGKLFNKALAIAGPIIVPLIAGVVAKQGGKLVDKATTKALADKVAGR